jgi:DnaK suppressor protein
MDQKQIDRFRAQLEEQRDEVLAEMADHRPAAVDDEKTRRDREDQALRAASDLTEQRIIADHQNLLKKIDFALERLAAGTYQECARCGARIPLERLRAKPSASLCIPCQEAKDAGKFEA